MQLGSQGKITDEFLFPKFFGYPHNIHKKRFDTYTLLPHASSCTSVHQLLHIPFPTSCSISLRSHTYPPCALVRVANDHSTRIPLRGECTALWSRSLRHQPHHSCMSMDIQCGTVGIYRISSELHRDNPCRTFSCNTHATTSWKEGNTTNVLPSCKLHWLLYRAVLVLSGRWWWWLYIVTCYCCIPYQLALMLVLTFAPCILTFAPCTLCLCGVSFFSTGANIPLAQVVVVTSYNLWWWWYPAATSADGPLAHVVVSSSATCASVA